MGMELFAFVGLGRGRWEEGSERTAKVIQAPGSCVDEDHQSPAPTSCRPASEHNQRLPWVRESAKQLEDTQTPTATYCICRKPHPHWATSPKNEDILIVSGELVKIYQRIGTRKKLAIIAVLNWNIKRKKTKDKKDRFFFILLCIIIVISHLQRQKHLFQAVHMLRKFSWLLSK